MGHFRGAGGTVGRGLGQGGADHVAQRDGDSVGQRRRRLVDVGEGGRHHAAGVERALTREHLVSDHAQGIDVAGGGRTLTQSLLGGKVLGGSEDLAGLGQGHRVDRAGDAEIRELDGAVGGEHDIGRLHVAVDDPALMSSGQSGGGLDEDRHSLLR